MATINTCHISAGCNRTPHSLDWGRNNLICYGSCQAVIISQPEVCDGAPASILHTLAGHKGRVNCVTWIRNQSQEKESELVSGSTDKTAIVWRQNTDQYTMVQALVGHTAPVTIVRSVTAPVKGGAQSAEPGGPEATTLIATASVDSCVKIWCRGPASEFKMTQTTTYGSGFVLDMSLIVLPDTNLCLLACGCDDMKIHLYVEDRTPDGIQFVPMMVLTGHEDWVRALDFMLDESGDVLLASAAQDYSIRIWRLSSRPPDTGQSATSLQKLPCDADIQMKENTFKFKYQGGDSVYAVSLESVLCGHENWIYSVKWRPPTATSTSLPTHPATQCQLGLLSVSMDKTMILWQPDPDSGVWMEQARMGEVGGNTLGLYGGTFGPDTNSVVAHGYQGAFHHWSFNRTQETWEHMVTVGGHFDSVEDIDWDRGGGNFLLSASLDETVRLHTPWVTAGRQVKWYEIARPQVHGYAMQCVAMINRYRFASGADEKVIRVFDATKNFIENFCNICGLDVKTEQQKEEARSRPEGATVPALGLSNKAIFPEAPADMTGEMEIKPGSNDQYTDNVFTAVSLQVPPSEEHLLQNSLWPEVQKLYGHGYEVFSLACHPDNSVLASSCKAAKAEFSAVILWDTVTWQQVGCLQGHSLTVTQMAFSHRGRHLLTVSRDRTWCLYQKKTAEQPESDPLFSLVATVDKKTCIHSRIIWSCAWSHDDRYFLTASRDKKVIVWRCLAGPDSNVSVTAVDKLDVKDSATAVDMAPVMLGDNSYLVAVGLEKGHILLYKWTPDAPSPWLQMALLDNHHAHHLTVKKLRFRPVLGLAGCHGDDLGSDSKVKDRDDWLQLASCGADHAVKIFSIHLPSL